MTDDNRLLGAVASVDITPPVGYHLGGYGARTEPSNDVHDQLYGNVLLLDDGRTRLAIITLDLLALLADQWQELRQAVSEAASVPVENILVNCSHTHAGPDTRKHTQYVTMVAEQVAGMAGVASRQLQPVTMVYDEDSIEFNVNRRLRDGEGKTIMAPNPDGPVDRRVRVLRLDSEDAQPMAVLFLAVCHANALRADNLAISADFPGVAQSLVADAFAPECTPMFMQGCAGNVRANLSGGDGFRSGDEEDLRWCGYSLGAAAVRAAARAGTRERRATDTLGGELAVAETVLSLPNRNGGTTEYPIQAMQIGEVLLVGLTGEVFVEYAQQLEQRLNDWKQVLVAGYCHCRIGYVPTAVAFEEGGYEPSERSTPLTPECEELILNGVEELVGELQEMAG